MHGLYGGPPCRHYRPCCTATASEPLRPNRERMQNVDHNRVMLRCGMRCVDLPHRLHRTVHCVIAARHSLPATLEWFVEDWR